MWSDVGRDKDACVSPNHVQSTEFSPDGIKAEERPPHGEGSGVTTKALNTNVNERLASLKNKETKKNDTGFVQMSIFLNTFCIFTHYLYSTEELASCPAC